MHGPKSVVDRFLHSRSPILDSHRDDSLSPNRYYLPREPSHDNNNNASYYSRFHERSPNPSPSRQSLSYSERSPYPLDLSPSFTPSRQASYSSEESPNPLYLRSSFTPSCQPLSSYSRSPSVQPSVQSRHPSVQRGSSANLSPRSPTLSPDSYRLWRDSRS